MEKSLFVAELHPTLHISLSLSLLHPPPEPKMSDPNAASAYMPAVRFHLILDL